MKRNFHEFELFFVSAALLGLLFTGCQGYHFEEVPTSVIKEARWSKTFTVTRMVDILFVVDNSGSMAGEQRQLAESFRVLAEGLEDSYGDEYHIAVITTGMSSTACPSCTEPWPLENCTNETGESGVFQDLLGRNLGTDLDPDYVFEKNPGCRLVTAANRECFYDESTNSGLVLVGTTGCGYEKGLAPVREALSEGKLGGANRGFLRELATLAVVVISDEEDCGEVGDINEGTEYGAGDACYWASKGINPYGETSDMDGRLYRLTPVSETYDFLLGLKNGREDMVKFAAIVGVGDVDDPSSTEINYSFDGKRWQIDDACTTPGCTGDHCFAEPGTRYIALAEMFGLGERGNAIVDTICQEDFSGAMKRIVDLVECPRQFLLTEEILDPDLVSILLDGEPIPRYSCSIEGKMEECGGLGDDTCSTGLCVETWTYSPPQPEQIEEAPGGTIRFAEHYDPCNLYADGQQVHLELVYVTR